jgi:choice-of-anchor A domain-containing protein
LAFGLVLVAVVAAVSAPTAGTARPIARAAACDALGEADNYAIFSHENVTVPSGISMNGRIAAAGDVTLASGATISGSPSPAVIAGRDFIAGKSGGGGTVNGGVRYGRNKDVASNFTINGGLNQGASGIDFDEEFNDLALLSDAWAKLTPTPGAQAILQYGALDFHGYSTGLNVFNITAADQSSLVQGINITLDKGAQPGSTAPATVLINITTATPLEANASYLNLNGVSADRLIWNLPQAPSITFTRQVGWKGLILAPNASVSAANGAQLMGQLIAKDVPAGAWTLTGQAQTVCPPAPEPPPEPDRTLDLEPLCVDPFGNLAMRVANTGTRDREVDWRDIGTNKRDFGSFVAQDGRYEYFNVRGGDGDSRILMVADPDSSDPVTFDAVRGTDQRCGGKITITKQTVGPAPPGPWTVQIKGVDTDGVGTLTRSAQLAAGQSVVFDALGGYQSGSAAFGGVVGGITYAITEPDPLGGIAEISPPNPIHILGFSDQREQNELVTITNTYADSGGGGDGGDGGGQPIPPPDVPDPPPGPDLIPGQPGAPNADLVVTHTITPARARVGDTVRVTTQVRNAGAIPAVGVVARELPQFRRLQANRVARVESATLSAAGSCNSRRPLRCSLGTMAPGARVVIRVRAVVLVAAQLQSVVMASSQTPESNTTNNLDLAAVTVSEAAPHLRVGISAPPSGRVGAGLDYRVRVTGTGSNGARTVRLCAPRASTLTEVRAPGTFAVRRARCQDIPRLPRGRTVSFVVSGVPAAAGSLSLLATATAIDLPGVARATAQVPISGPLACGSALRLRC